MNPVCLQQWPTSLSGALEAVDPLHFEMSGDDLPEVGR
jgi:hypothetical protein